MYRGGGHTAGRCYRTSDAFALDEALMCCGLFTGRSDESVVWIYGDDDAARFNGVAVIGNSIDPFDVRDKSGLNRSD